jgi:hypothetical protein
MHTSSSIRVKGAHTLTFFSCDRLRYLCAINEAEVFSLLKDSHVMQIRSLDARAVTAAKMSFV